MSPLVETLKLKDGVIQNLEHHQRRMNWSMDELFPEAEKINLGAAIVIPEYCNSGVL